MSTTTPTARSQELAALLARIALGDRAAFEALYRATSGPLFGVVLRVNSDRGQAEEVLQEVYVNIWRAAAGYQAQQSQPLTWLTSIARNRAIDSLRRRATEPATVSRYGSPGTGDEGDEAEDLLEKLASEQAGPLDLLEQATRSHALERCMQGLSGEQRSSLALAYYQGFSHAEVAEHLTQPLGTVKSWVRRGLQSLKLCLDRAAGLLGTGTSGESA
ncbi:sigma-70 family RNA polymerase sigma factor [Paucibacter sediminis]|uniref:RNA polymerase sigma factor n=1 Tax=Paucibacter sediminis TaxID=3019553 RepID=A0AA95SSC4_9BURK|nr:sigma-70 family RNA polymerase sigma factor [Paucibacter sp. S2-9]WIT14361.1 sigma-70 family RNA polymerase sigma factor [Paucibacter sp. S2-9]